MACPDFRRIPCHRKMSLDLSVATTNVCKVSQARRRDRNASSGDFELVLSQ